MFDTILGNRNATVGTRLIAVIGVAALALLYQANGFAQVTSVRPGDRVRVTAPGLTGEPIVGIVLSLDGDVLSIGDDEGRPSRQLPLEAVTRLERSVYRASQAGRGALIGGGVGLITGALLGFATGSSCEDEIGCPGVGAGAAVLGGFGLAVGAGVGAMIGATKKQDVWQLVSGNQTRVGFSIDGRGATGVTVRLAH